MDVRITGSTVRIKPGDDVVNIIIFRRNSDDDLVRIQFNADSGVGVYFNGQPVYTESFDLIRQVEEDAQRFPHVYASSKLLARMKAAWKIVYHKDRGTLNEAKEWVKAHFERGGFGDPIV